MQHICKYTQKHAETPHKIHLYNSHQSILMLVRRENHCEWAKKYNLIYGEYTFYRPLRSYHTIQSCNTEHIKNDIMTIMAYDWQIEPLIP